MGKTPKGPVEVVLQGLEGSPLYPRYPCTTSYLFIFDCSSEAPRKKILSKTRSPPSMRGVIEWPITQNSTSYSNLTT